MEQVILRCTHHFQAEACTGAELPLHLLAAQALHCCQPAAAAAAHSPPISQRTSRGCSSHGDNTPPEASGRADDIAVCGTGAGAEGHSALVADSTNFGERSSERVNATIADVSKKGNAWYIRTRDAFRSRLASWVAEIEDELSSVILNIPSDGSAGSGGDPSDALMAGECCRHVVLKEMYTNPHLSGLSGAFGFDAGNHAPFDLSCRKDRS